MKAKFGHRVTDIGRIIKQTIEAMPTASSLEMANYTLANHAPAIIDWLTTRYDAERRAEPRKGPTIRKRPRLGHPGQVRLPGFEHIPTRIFVEPPEKRRKGTGRVTLLNATLADQVKSLNLAVDESAEELAQRRRLIALTRRYDKAQPGITVREVFKLQIARNAEASRKRATRARTSQFKNQ